MLWVVFCVMLWVNGQKYENLLQFNTSWLASLRTWYILDFVLASVIVAITLYLNVPPFSLRSCYTPWKRQKGFLIPEYFLGYWLKLYTSLHVILHFVYINKNRFSLTRTYYFFLFHLSALRIVMNIVPRGDFFVCFCDILFLCI